MSNVYKEYRLEGNRREIRVLKLHPGESSDGLSADLEVVNLNENPVYAAVSYSWEPQDPRKDILIGGISFSVGYNVFLLLHAFREKDSQLVLWIDAVCINQDDPIEKNGQIPLMTYIYRQASETLVYLGEESSDSRAVFTFVRNFEASQFENLSTSPEAEPWPAIRNLLRRRWWSRLWMLQEVLLSARPIACCGRDRVDFNQFAKLRICEERYMKDHVRDFGGLQLFNAGVPLEGCLLSWYEDRARLQRGGAPLQEWFSYTMRLGHTKPHDRVYGLLGLVTESERNDIEVNYDIPLWKLYTQAAINAFKKGGLQTFHYGYSIRNMDLPSWVPDWTAKEFVSYFDEWYGNIQAKNLGDNHMWAPLRHATVQRSWNLPATSHEDQQSCWAISADQRILAVKAIIFDRVSHAETVPFVPMYTGTVMSEYERHRLQREDLAVDACLKWESQVQSQQKDPYQNTCGRYEALWRTVIADRRFDKVSPPESSWGDLFEIWMRRKGPSDRLERRKAMFEYYAAAISRTSSRALLGTDLGYVALGPGRSKVGDSVAFFMGGPVPFVVRDTGNGSYEFIGECYLHGNMQGEAFTEETMATLKEIWLA